jgi:hypothetical protein
LAANVAGMADEVKRLQEGTTARHAQGKCLF